MDKTTQGIILMTLSTLLYGVFNPLLKKAGLSPLATLIVQLGFSWLVAFPFFMASEAYKGISLQSISLLFLAASLGSIAYVLAVQSFPLLPLWQIAMFNVVMPILVAVSSYFLLGEALSPKMFVGLGFMAVGMYIAFR